MNLSFGRERRLDLAAGRHSIIDPCAVGACPYCWVCEGLSSPVSHHHRDAPSSSKSCQVYCPLILFVTLHPRRREQGLISDAEAAADRC
jgi:hypothetical protein